MNQTFCAAAAEGSTIHCVGTVLKHGRSLGFTEVTIRAPPQADGSPGKLIAVGRHTKAFPPTKK